jgi:hypothetical protein
MYGHRNPRLSATRSLRRQGVNLQKGGKFVDFAAVNFAQTELSPRIDSLT